MNGIFAAAPNGAWRWNPGGASRVERLRWRESEIVLSEINCHAASHCGGYSCIGHSVRSTTLQTGWWLNGQDPITAPSSCRLRAIRKDFPFSWTGGQLSNILRASEAVTIVAGRYVSRQSERVTQIVTHCRHSADGCVSSEDGRLCQQKRPEGAAKLH